MTEEVSATSPEALERTHCYRFILTSEEVVIPSVPPTRQNCKPAALSSPKEQKPALITLFMNGGNIFIRLIEYMKTTLSSMI